MIYVYAMSVYVCAWHQPRLCLARSKGFSTFGWYTVGCKCRLLQQQSCLGVLAVTLCCHLLICILVYSISSLKGHAAGVHIVCVACCHAAGLFHMGVVCCHAAGVHIV